jgi:hypothetical protein
VKLDEIQKSALELPDGDRAALAAELLKFLPAVLVDFDEGIDEARRRLSDLEENANGIPATAQGCDEGATLGHRTKKLKQR